jgi:DNA-binding CsgD family transcriptional regulator
MGSASSVLMTHRQNSGIIILGLFGFRRLRLGRGEALFTAIEAIHSAGLEPARWTQALSSVTVATGSAAATLETYDLQDQRHRFWQGVGVDPVLQAEYLQLFSGQLVGAGRRPRKFPPGQVLDGSGRAREPFYNHYLNGADMRPFAAAMLSSPGERLETVFTLRAGAGEVSGEYLRAVEALSGHLKLSLNVGERLARARRLADGLLETLELIDAGAAVLAADGRVLHANGALRALARTGDGLDIGADGVRLASPQARRRLGLAMTALGELKGRRRAAAPPAFEAPRPSGAPALRLSLKPLSAQDLEATGGEAAAILLVRDPAGGSERQARAAQDRFALTAAEARLAQALMAGVSPVDFARRQGVSVNTVYTHLARLKEKAGARRLAELIGRLNGA